MMCDGAYLFPSKNGNPRPVDAIVLVAGNEDPKRMYPNTWIFLYERFHVIELTFEH